MGNGMFLSALTVTRFRHRVLASLPRLVSSFMAMMVLIGIWAAAPQKAMAQNSAAEPKYAAIVVDARTGEVLYARRADSPRYPASITKIMTLYLTFQALSEGHLKLDDPVLISPRAAAQAPSKLGLAAGETLNVDQAIRAVSVKSANDVAVALAEKIAGNESRFAALMTLKAEELGMSRTRFVNASGLPDSRQISSARDIAILSRAVMRDYPQYYSYFNVRNFTFRGVSMNNHNGLLFRTPGVDGLKTGFTNASGYNLAASMVKDNRRLITVVMGGQTGRLRDDHVAKLLLAGFEILDRRARGENLVVAQNEFEKIFANDKPISSRPIRQSDVEDEDKAEGVSDTPQKSQPDLVKQASAAFDSLTAPLRQAMTPEPQPGQLRPSKGSMAPIPDPVPPSRTRTGPVQATAAPSPAATKTTAQVLPDRTAAAETAGGVSASISALLANTAAHDPEPTQLRDAKSTKPAPGNRDLARKDPNATWQIQVGAFKDADTARDWMKSLEKSFKSELPHQSRNLDKVDGWYRVRYQDMTKEAAHSACKALTTKNKPCMVIRPDA